MVKKLASPRERALSQCAQLVGAELTYPFGDEVDVFKVGGKMFALASLDDDPARLTLKCDPDYASYLTQEFADISPGYHMNKRHWITLTLSTELSGGLVDELIVDSYELIVSSLPASLRRELSPPAT